MRIHCGCGPIILPGWINIDIEPSHNPDVCMDYLRLSERFGDVDLIFCCHSLEHIPFSAGVETALAQMFAALKPGGIVRIVAPDLMLVAQKFVSGQDLKDVYVGPGKYHLGDIDCAATRFAFFARAWSHEVLFDERLLGQMMRASGFVNVRKCAFGQSDTPALRGLDRFPAESLSMEGTKP